MLKSRSRCVAQEPQLYLPAGESGFRPCLVPGTMLGRRAPPGFPSLNSLEVSAELKKAGVTALGMPSKRESLILTIQASTFLAECKLDVKKYVLVLVQECRNDVESYDHALQRAYRKITHLLLTDAALVSSVPISVMTGKWNSIPFIAELSHATRYMPKILLS